MSGLGQKIRELRTARGMSQQALAERAQVGHSLITALESGRRRYVSAQDIERLARGLAEPADELWKLVPGGRSEARYISIFPGSDVEPSGVA